MRTNLQRVDEDYRGEKDDELGGVVENNVDYQNLAGHEIRLKGTLVSVLLTTLRD